MNGLIHACTHDNDEARAGPKRKISDKEVYLKIFQYIDKLFNLIQPTKNFFMAVDGVAPRAKMNQQRSRRFRSSKEAEESRAEAIKKGEKVPERHEVFNSNCITPGTEFMCELDSQIEYFIRSKMEVDIRWQQCKVVYSSHQAPGEGTSIHPNFKVSIRLCLLFVQESLKRNIPQMKHIACMGWMQI